MAIEETIDVSVAGIGQVDALAAALDKAAQAAARLNGMVAKGGAGAGGGAGGAGAAEKQAAAMDAAAARTEKAAKRMSAAMESMSGIGDAAAAGLAPAADAIDAVAAANARLAESGKLAANAQRAVARATVAAGKAMDKTAEGTDAAAAANGRVARTSGESAAALDAQAAAASRSGRSHATAAESSTKFWKGVKVAAIGGAVAVAYGLDQAMKLQTQTTRLFTAAGLQGVSQGDVTKSVLSMGSKTGFSGTAIAEAMYHPVSAGLDFKTAQALTEQSANLANVHGANLDDTTYAMSSVMKAYNMNAKQAIPTAALLNSIVGQGDMRFQDFNQSVKNFAPTGASMGISLQSMGAGLAYLTDRGNTAEVASTRLTMGLGMATAGSKAANTYLRDLGLTTGSLTLKNKSLQATMEKGGLTTNKFASDLKKPDGLYVALSDMQHAFTKAGLSSSQADQVMSKIFGGGRSDKAIVSLMQNLDGLRQKYNQIGQDATPAKYMASVAKEQATAQQKWKDFLASGQNLAAGFGNAMLPTFTKIAGAAAGLLQGPGGGIAGGALGGAIALFAGKKLFSGVESAASTIGKVAKFLNVPGLSKLSGIGGVAGSGMATAGLEAVGGAADGAAAALGRLGGVAGEAGLAGGLAGGKGAGLAQEEAAAASMGIGGALKTGLGGVMAGGLVAAIAVPLAMQADKYLQKHLGNTQASGLAQIGTGALAGAAIGATVGSVIPGLGTAVGGIAGALVGGLTTALSNSKVWNDVFGAPKPAGKPTAAAPPAPVWQIPGTGGSPMPVLKTPPAKDPTIGWVAANMIDQKRHATAAGFDTARHAGATAADWVGGSFDTTRHQGASVGQAIARLFGYKPPPPPPPSLPQAAPHQWMSVTGTGGYYPNGQPFFGQPHQAFPATPVQPVTPAAPGKLAALSQTVNVKPIKIPPPDTSAIAGAMAKMKLLSQPQNIKPLKIPAPDMSAVGAAKGKLQALSQVTLKAPKMPAPDMSALDSAKGKAQSAGSGITSAIQGAMKPAKMPAPDLSAASGAVGTASGIGSAIGAGLAAGIRSQIGAVQAAAAALAAAASSAMAAAAKVHSPSEVTKKIGLEMAAGAQVGLVDGTPGVADAAGKTATKAADAMKAKAKAAAKIGKDLVSSLITGLQGGQAAIDAANTALGQTAKAADIKSIDDTIAKLKKDVTGKPAMVMWLEGQQSDLERLAAKRTQLTTEITNSTQAAQNAISGASITNALTAVNPAGNEPVSSYAVVQGQQYQASGMAAFAKQLLSLQKAGLNATSLSQIGQAGPDQGLSLAQGITSGGPAAIRQLNQLQKQIHASATQIGDVTGVAMYQSGKDIAQGLAAGLKDALKANDKELAKLAAQTVGIIGKVTPQAKAKAAKAGKSASSGGTSSGTSGGSAPGSAAAGSAGSVPVTGAGNLAGAAAALTGSAGRLSGAAAALSAAAGALGKAAAGGGSGASGGAAGGVKGAGGHAAAPGIHPAAGGYGGGGYGGSLAGGGFGIAKQPGGGHGGDVHVHLHVAGNARVDKDWAKQMQTIFLNQADRNLRTGLQLRDRGA